MADNNKVTPWEDYNYSANLPDFWEVTGIMMAVVSCKAYLSWKVRPLRSQVGLATLAGFVTGGYLLAKGLTSVRDKFLRQRQVFVEHYVDTHPEQFATQAPKKYKDVLLKWNPVR